MANPSISLRFTVFLSLSLSVTPFALSPNYNKQSPISKATPSDLLNLLGSKSQASAVNPSSAKELKSCFKFLVPFNPIRSNVQCSSRRSLRSSGFGNRSRREEDELVWWPPASVLELARLAVDSGGDPGAIHRTLDPAVIPVSFISLLQLVNTNFMSWTIVLLLFMWLEMSLDRYLMNEVFFDVIYYGYI